VTRHGAGNGGVVQTGIVRRVDELGRIVIPSEIRKRLGLSRRDPVEFSLSGETIMLTKSSVVCVFCGAAEPLLEHRGRHVCRACVSELAS
jgi:AbrB family transcriptional regulator, transcriptional pleiotropic regulator of transition state genes